MGLFSSSPQQRAKNAWAAADRTRRRLDEMSKDGRELEYRMELLYKLAGNLPPHTPVDTIKNIEYTMTITERHTKYALIHLRKLNTHLKELDDHLKRMEQKIEERKAA